MDRTLEGVNADVQLCTESGHIVERRVRADGGTEDIDALTTNYISFSTFAESLKMGQVDQLVAVNKDGQSLLSHRIPRTNDTSVIVSATGGPLSEVLLAKGIVESTVKSVDE